MHVPGLRVFAPTTPHDAKGCLTRAIRDDNPVLVIEHRMLHSLQGIVPDESYETAYGEARILSPGKDVTIVGISHMAVEAVRAKHLLAAEGIDAEVIDPVCLSPLDVGTIAKSVTRTGRLLVVDTGWLSCGASSEIITSVIEFLEGDGSFQVRRLGYHPTPCPTTKPLENLFYPSPVTIARAAFEMVRGKGAAMREFKSSESAEVTEFRGPF
jgi:pyruvate dehydrogenase E1 component beta subunit